MKREIPKAKHDCSRSTLYWCSRVHVQSYWYASTLYMDEAGIDYMAHANDTTRRCTTISSRYLTYTGIVLIRAQEFSLSQAQS